MRHAQIAATPKFEVKRPGVSGHSNDVMDVPFSGYFASNFAGAARKHSQDVVALGRVGKRGRAGALLAAGLPTSDQCSIHGVL